MGKLTRKIDPNAKSGFEPFDGPEPKPGMYRAKIVKVAIRAAGTGTLGYNVLVNFEATKPEHKQYDGFSTFVTLWMGDKENMIAREGTFYKAITGKNYPNVTDVNVVYEGSEDDFTTPAGAEVKKIDGVSPIGKIVKVNMQIEKGGDKGDGSGEKYEDRLRGNDIYPTKEEAPAAAPVVEDEDDEDPEVDEDGVVADADDDEDDAELQAEIEERRKELRGRSFGLAKLREAAKAADIETKGKDKTALVEAILEWEFAADDDDADDADDDEDEIPDDQAIAESEADDEEEDEDDEEDDEDDEDEDEDDEEDELAELRAELAGLDRVALKKRIKANDEGFSVKKSMSDDDLRETIVTQESESVQGPF